MTVTLPFKVTRLEIRTMLKEAGFTVSLAKVGVLMKDKEFLKLVVQDFKNAWDVQNELDSFPDSAYDLYEEYLKSKGIE